MTKAFLRILLERVAILIALAGYVLVLGVIPLSIGALLPFPLGVVGAVVWILAGILIIGSLQDAYEENRYRRLRQQEAKGAH